MLATAMPISKSTRVHVPAGGPGVTLRQAKQPAGPLLRNSKSARLPVLLLLLLRRGGPLDSTGRSDPRPRRLADAMTPAGRTTVSRGTRILAQVCDAKIFLMQFGKPFIIR